MRAPFAGNRQRFGALWARVGQQSGRISMNSILKSTLATATLAAAFAAPAFAQPAPQPWNPDPSISASLDVGGSGSFTGVFDKGQLCYILTAAGIDGVTAAKIVSTKPDKNGQVVLHLQPPVGGASAGCSPVDGDLAKRLVKNAENFALQIDSATYPQGAASAPLTGQNG
jgi:hypothetical protein